jgi:4-amino-4-deoxy-L-arabinose transferase-like glycosyltransferase
MNYFQDNNPFLQPSVHNLGSDGTGKSVSEFPLLYYAIGQLWKIFGHHEFIYRFLVLLFFFFGLLSLHKLIENILKDSILALIFTLLLFSSPTLVFYANNFLMNIPAFSLALIGLYFFFRFTETSKNRYFYLFALSYALAGLLKITSLLSFVAIFGLFLLELSGVQMMQEKKIFQHPKKQLLLFLLVFCIQILWYWYAVSYDRRYNGGFFLLGILPIWDFSLAQIKTTLEGINNQIMVTHFLKITPSALLIMFILIIIFYKKIDKKLFVLTILCSIGVVLMVLLFFQVLDSHDYYAIDLFIIVPFISLSFLTGLKNNFNNIYTSVLFRVMLVIILCYNVDFARSRMISRYDPGGWEDDLFVKYVGTFCEIKPYLHSIGIKENDRVWSMSDNSINISLYLMNQKGWTNYGVDTHPANVDKIKKLGAKYLVIYNKEDYSNKDIQPYIKHKIGEYKNVDIYRL